MEAQSAAISDVFSCLQMPPARPLRRLRHLRHLRHREHHEVIEMESSDSKPTLNPMAMSAADAARLLSKVSGEKVSEEMLRADLAAGAPTNPDGTINLVQFTAWLVKEMSHEK